MLGIPPGKRWLHTGATEGICRTRDGRFYWKTLTYSDTIDGGSPVIPNLEEYLVGLNDKLKTEGKIVFLENAYSNRVFHVLRYLKHNRGEFKKIFFLF